MIFFLNKLRYKWQKSVNKPETVTFRKVCLQGSLLAGVQECSFWNISYTCKVILTVWATEQLLSFQEYEILVGKECLCDNLPIKLWTLKWVSLGVIIVRLWVRFHYWRGGVLCVISEGGREHRKPTHGFLRTLPDVVFPYWSTCVSFYVTVISLSPNNDYMLSATGPSKPPNRVVLGSLKY